MTWLAWRQLRANALVALAASAALVVVLIATRERSMLVASTDALSSRLESLRLLGTALIGAPVVLGAFWGAPLLAREIEAGTHRLVWVQSITRRRWLLTRLGTTAILAVLVVAAFSLVFTWWSAPFDEMGSRIGTANFGQRGVVPIAYTLFALALGTFLGAVIRRTLPAMAVTAVVFFVVRFAFQLLVRPHLIASVEATVANNSFGQRDEQMASMGSWILSSRTVDAQGRTLTSSQVDRLLVDACHLQRDSTRRDWIGCIDRVGVQDRVRYHPADHFWTLQIWESTGFLALALLLVGASLWWVQRRTT